MLKNIFFTFGLIIGVSLFGYSQDAIDQELVDLANEMFDFGDYNDALEIYLSAIDINPDNAEAHWKAGLCYLRTPDRQANSVDRFIDAKKLDPKINNMIYYEMGQGYKFDYQFENAIRNYNRFIEELTTNYRFFEGQDIVLLKARAEKRILECENASSYTTNKLKVEISNLGGDINSENSDYAPTLSAKEDILIFTSRREGTTGGLKANDNKWYEDIYISRLENGKWGIPQNLGEPVNTNGHDSNLSLSPDGKTLYIYKTNEKGFSDIYYSENKNDNWSKPKPLDKDINSDQDETSFSISSDNSKAFFTSNKEGTNGGTDIYMIKIDEKGKWGKPEHLSNIVNSSYDEEGPVYNPATQTLYFSSNGHDNIGGFDIFKSDYDESTNTWSKPENLGYPINTTSNDVFIAISEDGKRGYYSTIKKDSKGETDLYMIHNINEEHDKDKEKPEEIVEPETLLTPEPEEITEVIEEKDTTEEVIEPIIVSNLIEKTPKEKPEPEILPTPEPEEIVEVIEPEEIPETVQEQKELITSIKIVIEVISQNSRTPLDANISIVRKDTDEEIFKGKCTNGTVTVNTTGVLPINYIVVAEKQGYKYATKEIRTASTALENIAIKEILALQVEQTGVIYPFRNIYFDFDKVTLKNESHVELDKLTQMLQSNPDMTILVAGHADYIGDHSYNQDLSEKRAKAVQNHLAKNGIDSSRIKTIGFGETKPLATNDDELEGREINRRTEFIITKK